jgi:predicted transcriptional regulator
MRTTVDIDEAVLDRAKRLASSEKRTLGALVSEAVAAYVAVRRKPTKDAPFELIVRGTQRGRFPTPAELAAAQDEEDLGSLNIPGVRRASP